MITPMTRKSGFMSDYSSTALTGQEEIKAPTRNSREIEQIRGQLQEMVIVEKPQTAAIPAYVSQQAEEFKTFSTKETDQDQCETSIENGKKYT